MVTVVSEGRCALLATYQIFQFVVGYAMAQVGARCLVKCSMLCNNQSVNPSVSCPASTLIACRPNLTSSVCAPQAFSVNLTY